MDEPRISNRRSLQLTFVLILLWCSTRPFLSWAIQDVVLTSSSSTLSVKDILSSAKAAPSTSKPFLYQGLISVERLTPEETRLVYAQIMNEGKNTGDKNVKSNVALLNRALAKSVSDEDKPVIADLLAKSVAQHPGIYGGPYAARSQRVADQEMVHYEAIKTIIKVAGDTHNQEAIGVLRQMAHRDDILADPAREALGNIGDPQDLEDFVQRLKTDPNFTVDLTPFGTRALKRVVDEVHGSSLSPSAKARLTSQIALNYGKDAVPIYTRLLSDNDAEIRKNAAIALGRYAGPANSSVIVSMLRSPDSSVRAEALRSIDGPLWNSAYTGMVASALLHDPNFEVRAAACNIFIDHPESSDANALTQAANHDNSSLVRESAKAALQLKGRNNH